MRLVLARRALMRFAADPAALAAFNGARLSPEAANLIAACRRRDGSAVEAFKACVRAWMPPKEGK